ncbi:hypothetical protein PG984_007519 [Apiospora sp. TS-2023a]
MQEPMQQDTTGVIIPGLLFHGVTPQAQRHSAYQGSVEEIHLQTLSSPATEEEDVIGTSRTEQSTDSGGQLQHIPESPSRRGNSRSGKRLSYFCSHKGWRILRLLLAITGFTLSIFYDMYNGAPLNDNKTDDELKSYYSGQDYLVIGARPAYMAVLMLWDIFRILHHLYERAPGWHLEGFLTIEVGLIATGLAFLPFEPTTRYWSGIDDMVLLTNTARIILIVWLFLIIITSGGIAIYHALLYPKHLRQRRQYFRIKPKLGFSATGDLVAVYMSDDQDPRRLSLDSLQGAADEERGLRGHTTVTAQIAPNASQ